MANDGKYSHVQLSPDELRALCKALTHTMATWMDPRGNHDLSPAEVLLLTYLTGKFHGLLLVDHEEKP